MPVKPALVAFVLLAMMIPALAGCLDTLESYVPGPVQPTDYLRDARYTEWIIEIDYVQGHKPDSEATSLLKSRMQELARKDTVTVRVDDAIARSSQSWTEAEIADLRKEYQDEKTGDSKVVTWVVYLDGEFAEGDTALGVTFDFDMVALFEEQISGAAFLFVSTQDIERAVLVHEFGHVIGLVNRGVDMVRNHEDPDHPRHSDNSGSVMYWAVESTSIGNQFSGGVPTEFDADDKADVCAAGGYC